MEFQDKCNNCGHPRQSGDAYCPNCGQPFEEPKAEPEQQAPPPPAEPAPDAESAEQPKYVPWEDRPNKGFFAAIWETWRDALIGPEAFFSKLPYRGGIWNPLIYALIVIWVGLAVEQLWGNMVSGFFINRLAELVPPDELFWTTGLQTGFSFMYLVFSIVLIPVGLFVISGIYHLILMMFGWAKRDFEATFRTFAYASSPLILKVIPFCGGFIGWVWAIVLAIIGLKHMQKTTGGQAALVIFLPIVLCCCLVIVLALIFGAAFAAFISELMKNSNMYY